MPAARTATKSTVPPQTASRIRRRLLAWFDANRRDLPWRHRQSDAYAQWVAEIMLQQTRVETVRAYYDRFLARFPNVSTLARARRETVLKHWEGLGYYRRALHLHEAAMRIHRNGGAMPASFEELRNLPGIGDYTAAAIASIAYREPVAAVDGNVARVIARLFAIRENILSPGGRGRVQQIAGRLLSRDRPGDFNQAWMDLGSRICTPRRPRCDVCPLESSCQSKTAGVTDQFPVRGNGRAAKPHCAIVSVVFVHDGRLLVIRRPRGGLWSELWEFPSADRGTFPSTAAAVRRIADEAGVLLDSRPRKAGIVNHELTHRSLAFHVFVADVEETRVANRRVRWVDRAGFTKLSVSTAHRRVFETARVHLALR